MLKVFQKSKNNIQGIPISTSPFLGGISEDVFIHRLLPYFNYQEVLSVLCLVNKNWKRVCYQDEVWEILFLLSSFQFPSGYPLFNKKNIPGPHEHNVNSYFELFRTFFTHPFPIHFEKRHKKLLNFPVKKNPCLLQSTIHKKKSYGRVFFRGVKSFFPKKGTIQMIRFRFKSQCKGSSFSLHFKGTKKNRKFEEEKDLPLPPHQQDLLFRYFSDGSVTKAPTNGIRVIKKEREYHPFISNLPITFLIDFRTFKREETKMMMYLFIGDKRKVSIEVDEQLLFFPSKEEEEKEKDNKKMYFGFQLIKHYGQKIEFLPNILTQKEKDYFSKKKVLWNEEE